MSDPQSLATVTQDAAETEALAAQFAKTIKPGAVVLVRGDLGAGKTTFVRGACRALGVTEPVTSPTFTIGQVYEGKSDQGEPLLISHLDLYRLADIEAEDPGLIEDYFDKSRVVFLEWPEVATAPLISRASHEVSLEHAGEDRRRLTITRS